MYLVECLSVFVKKKKTIWFRGAENVQKVSYIAVRICGVNDN